MLPQTFFFVQFDFSRHSVYKNINAILPKYKYFSGYFMFLFVISDVCFSFWHKIYKISGNTYFDDFTLI